MYLLTCRERQNMEHKDTTERCGTGCETSIVTLSVTTCMSMR